MGLGRPARQTPADDAMRFDAILEWFGRYLSPG
jgi:hypothetical protein